MAQHPSDRSPGGGQDDAGPADAEGAGHPPGQLLPLAAGPGTADGVPAPLGGFPVYPSGDRTPRHPGASRLNELWQTDIRYVRVGSRNYYLISFLDAYSRYVVYHELLRSM